MNVICGRITREFRDVSGMLMLWAEQSTEYYVYEHSADEDINRTHVHFLFKGSKATVKNLKERKDYKDLKLERTDHAYKDWDESKGQSYITYMTKGSLEPKLTSNNETCKLAKSQWKSSASVEADKKKKIKNSNDGEYDRLCEEFDKNFEVGATLMSSDVLIYVRKWVLRYYYKKDGILPPVSKYKRYAASLFYRFCLSRQDRCGDVALDEIISWY